MRVALTLAFLLAVAVAEAGAFVRAQRAFEESRAEEKRDASALAA